MPATNGNPEDNTTDAEVHVLHGTPAPTGQTIDDVGRDDYTRTLSKARSNAVTQLRRDNRAEYDDYVTRYMNSAGYDYSPPLTPEQRAAQKIRDLASQYGLPVTIETS